MARKFTDRIVFMPPGRAKTLQDMVLPILLPNGMLPVSTPDPRVRWEWNVRIMGAPTVSSLPVVPRTDYLPLGPVSPWHIDEHYDPEGTSNADQLAIVNSDFEAAVDLAVRWYVLGEEVAAQACIRILNAWTTIVSFDTNAGSVLNWNNKWPLMIQAALLMDKHPSLTSATKLALRDITSRGMVINTAFTHDNNWGAWGSCSRIAAAIFLQDRAMFDQAIQRWRTLFDIAVVDNVPVEEVYRQGSGSGDGSYGLWYSNFFLYGMTAAAEWARFAGEWLYDYRGEDGSTFEGLALNIRHWTRFPAEFPYNTSGVPSTTVRICLHDDVLHSLWPDAASQWLLDNFLVGSVRDNFGIRQAVLTYRDRPLYG